MATSCPTISPSSTCQSSTGGQLIFRLPTSDKSSYRKLPRVVPARRARVPASELLVPPNVARCYKCGANQGDFNGGVSRTQERRTQETRNPHRRAAHWNTRAGGQHAQRNKP